MNKLSAYFLCITFIITSCSKRNLVYFSDLEGEKTYTEEITNKKEVTIQPDDLLSIHVTSLNPESNALFNRGGIASVRPSSNYADPNNNSVSSVSSEGYLVDKDGYIEFPVLGRVMVGGLTTAEAKAMITKQLGEYLKEPTVNIHFLNFTITVIGEVSRPTTLTIPSESINVLEVLGMAGDMTVYGKRENVLVIREEDGKRTLTRLNLNSKEVFQSPYFYLQQNDIVYVEPNNAREAQASMTRTNVSLALAIVSVVSIFLTRFL